MGWGEGEKNKETDRVAAAAYHIMYTQTDETLKFSFLLHRNLLSRACMGWGGGGGGGGVSRPIEKRFLATATKRTLPDEIPIAKDFSVFFITKNTSG